MTDAPKVIVNDEYLDLRSSSSKEKLPQHCNKSHSRHPSLVNEGVKMEKELLIKDLVQNYNSIANRTHYVRKKKDLTTLDPRFRKTVEPPKNEKFISSQSELSLPQNVEFNCSTPSSSQIIRSLPKSVDKSQEINEEIQSDYHVHMECGEPNAMTLPTDDRKSPNYSGGNTNSQDPRLLRKYSVLKMPWKRTWTLPVITRKSNHFREQIDDIVDRQTYKYDDGTEIDSLFIQPIIVPHGKVIHTKLMMLLFILGSGTGLLVVALIIWFLFTNEILKTMIKPKNEIGIVKKSLRMISGTILYVISSAVNTIGNVLTLPTHQVYQPTDTNPLWS